MLNPGVILHPTSSVQVGDQERRERNSFFHELLERPKFTIPNCSPHRTLSNA